MIHAKKVAEDNGVKVALTFSDPAINMSYGFFAPCRGIVFLT